MKTIKKTGAQGKPAPEQTPEERGIAEAVQVADAVQKAGQAQAWHDLRACGKSLNAGAVHCANVWSNSVRDWLVQKADTVTPARQRVLQDGAWVAHYNKQMGREITAPPPEPAPVKWAGAGRRAVPDRRTEGIPIEHHDAVRRACEVADVLRRRMADSADGEHDWYKWVTLRQEGKLRKAHCEAADKHAEQVRSLCRAAGDDSSQARMVEQGAWVAEYNGLNRDRAAAPPEPESQAQVRRDWGKAT